MNADPPTHFRPAAPENLWANRRRRLRPQEVLNANELEKGRAYEISLLSGAIRNRLRPAVSTRSEAGAVSDVDSIKPDTLVRCIDAPDLSLILKTVLRAIGRCHPNFQKARATVAGEIGLSAVLSFAISNERRSSSMARSTSGTSLR